MDGDVLDIQTAEVFQDLLAPARWKGAHGGRGSAKSHFFADLLIDYAMHRPGLRWLCVREHQNSLQQSVMQLLVDKIKAYGLGFFFRVTRTHIVTPGGGIINFVGMKNHTADSIKSYEGYDGAWVEEAQSLSQRSFDLLYPTIRKPGSELWFSWNPNSPKDPVDAHFRGAHAIEMRAGGDMIVVQANYMHNPWLPEVMRKDMEFDKRRDPDRYRHIWLGDYNRKSNARVFKNWRIADPGTIPDRASFKRLYYGGDFGFANDPTVAIEMAIDGRTLYILDEAYRIGCEVDHTPLLFGGMDDWELTKKNELAHAAIKAHPEFRPHEWRGIEGMRKWPLIADSARPETISYLKRHGFPLVEPARKGPGSVEEGVTFLQTYDIVIAPHCVHSIDEFTMYSFEIDDKTDEILPKLADKKNHVIDSARYAVEKVRRARAGVF